MKSLAQSYGISRQGLYQLMERNGLTRSELSQPDIVFNKLLENRASHLRVRLTDPRNRAKIAKKLSKLSA
jgi:hypothetical protein